jgi:hypothetical protein
MNEPADGWALLKTFGIMIRSGVGSTEFISES